MSTLALPLGSYRLPQPAASVRRVVNAYAQEAPPERPRGQPAQIVRAPGIDSFVDTSAQEVRGAILFGNVLIVVADSSVFSLTEAGVLTTLTGAAVTGNGPVRMATNGTTILIAPGNGAGFSCNGSTVTAISDAAFTDSGGGADPAFLDGYIVLRRPGTARFFNSGLNALTWNALDITTADGAPDDLVGLMVSNREIILPGETSTEVWYNAANSPGSPFSRSPGGFHELGCAAGASLANQDNSVLMLASDLTFRRLAGSWQRVSQYGIESILQRMSLRSDCYAIPYRQEGHHFVAWTFPNAGRTLVLDLNTGEWHERESRIGTVSIGRWRPSCIVQAWGKQIVGDSQSGQIGILDPDISEEFGEPQVVSATFQPVYADHRNVVHRRFELGISAGQGTATGQGANPLCTLHVSDDSGNTWRARPMREMGRLGEYRRRVQWFNLGASRERVYRIDFSDPVRMIVLDAQLEAEGARV